MLVTCFSEKLTAQNTDKDGSPKYYRIHNVIATRYTFDVLNDSIPLYTFYFKINVKKIGKTQIVKVTANDSLAYSMFTTYKKYNSFDFGPYMSNKKEVNIILPILVLNNDGKDFSAFSKVPLISVSEVVKLFERILYLTRSEPNILMLGIMRVEKLNIPKK
ncbi:hypothetical protein [Flavobacterium sp.]|uniref:hypothetical protein n=1 Tax=Flavobacterium sp. TaxID=239 RepID=UPI003C523D55